MKHLTVTDMDYTNMESILHLIFHFINRSCRCYTKYSIDHLFIRKYTQTQPCECLKCIVTIVSSVIHLTQYVLYLISICRVYNNDIIIVHIYIDKFKHKIKYHFTRKNTSQHRDMVVTPYQCISYIQ